MSDQERAINPYAEQERIKVALGEPFVISPNFQLLKECPDQIVLQEVNLEIENLGQGKIKILKDKTMGEMTEQVNVRTPAGPVEIKYVYVMDNSQPVPESLEPASLPWTIYMYIHGLIKKQLDETIIELFFDEKKFKGENNFDDVELEQEGRAELHVLNWIDPETGEICELYFPENPEILSRIKFIIRTKT